MPICQNCLGQIWSDQTWSWLPSDDETEEWWRGGEGEEVLSSLSTWTH